MNPFLLAGADRSGRSIPLLKDLPCAGVPKESRAAKDSLDAGQPRFCDKLLSDLYRKAHRNVVSPFYELIGMSAPFPRASELFLTATLCRIRFPGYSIPPKTIKEPTVLSTMQLDFKLVIRNCFRFAPERQSLVEFS